MLPVKTHVVPDRQVPADRRRGGGGGGGRVGAGDADGFADDADLHRPAVAMDLEIQVEAGREGDREDIDPGAPDAPSVRERLCEEVGGLESKGRGPRPSEPARRATPGAIGSPGRPRRSTPAPPPGARSTTRPGASATRRGMGSAEHHHPLKERRLQAVVPAGGVRAFRSPGCPPAGFAGAASDRSDDAYSEDVPYRSAAERSARNSWSMSNCDRIHQTCGRKNQIDCATLAAVLNQWSDRSAWAISCSRLRRSGSGSSRPVEHLGDQDHRAEQPGHDRMLEPRANAQARARAARDRPATSSSNRARAAGDGGRERRISQWTPRAPASATPSPPRRTPGPPLSGRGEAIAAASRPARRAIAAAVGPAPIR